MPSLSKAPLTGQALLRILFRWKWHGFLFLFATLPISLWWAVKASPHYAAEMIIERKPTRTLMTSEEGKEFEVTRLTSDTQRTVALLKSRYMMERWFDALGVEADARHRDREIRRLAASLTVRPINYTDLFVVRVKAKSFDEARRRTEVFSRLWQDLDDDARRRESVRLNALIEARLHNAQETLTRLREDLNAQGGKDSLRLGGSVSSKEIDNKIVAEEKLYDQLILEREEAQRGVDSSKGRIQVIAPATGERTPLRSRSLNAALGGAGCLLGMVFFLILLEWQDPSVHRVGDVYRMVGSFPVMAVPRLGREERGRDEGALYLEPIRTAWAELKSKKAEVMIQVSSARGGEGKTFIASTLARLLAKETRVCLVHRYWKLIREDGAGVPGVDVSIGSPVEGALSAHLDQGTTFVIDNDVVAGSLPSHHLLKQADILCFVLSAGRTSSAMLTTLERQLSSFAHQKIILVLNGFEDPLPPCFR